LWTVTDFTGRTAFQNQTVFGLFYFILFYLRFKNIYVHSKVYKAILMRPLRAVHSYRRFSNVGWHLQPNEMAIGYFSRMRYLSLSQGFLDLDFSLGPFFTSWNEVKTRVIAESNHVIVIPPVPTTVSNGVGPISLQIIIFFCVNLDEDKFYMKILSFERSTTLQFKSF
jgi:hypothetical protein